MISKIASAITILGFLPAAQAATPDQIRESANKAVQRMENSMAYLTPKVPCASCHHGMLPLWTLGIARDHGVTVNETLRQNLAVRTYSSLRNVDAAIQGTHVVDATVDVSEALAFAREVGVAPSVTTALYARRLANFQQADGHWKTLDARPPQSYSPFMVTAMTGRTVAAFLPESEADEKFERLNRARQWFVSTQPVSTEDATFRVLGLAWIGGTRQEIHAAAKDLATRQNQDGGFSPMPGRPSDAYSTGEALFALKSTGFARDEVYTRGVDFLLRTQLEDGTWLVKTRLHEVAQISPPKMDTGFPHGNDQITSMFGTTWAVAALSLALPEQKQLVAEITKVRPEAEPWVEIAAFGTPEQMKTIDPNAHTQRGSTALMVAAADPERATMLIQNGADIKAVAASGQTALSIAASYRGTSGLVRQLIQAGVPVTPDHKVEFNANPLVEVAWTGDVEVARALLDAGADMHQVMNRAGFFPMTPIRAAVILNTPEILREYLQRGADPNMVEDIPMLSWAAISNRPEVAKVLIEAGADPTLRDHYGWTPLQHSHGVDHDVNQTESLIEAAIYQTTAKTASHEATLRVE